MGGITSLSAGAEVASTRTTTAQSSSDSLVVMRPGHLSVRQFVQQRIAQSRSDSFIVRDDQRPASTPSKTDAYQGGGWGKTQDEVRSPARPGPADPAEPTEPTAPAPAPAPAPRGPQGLWNAVRSRGGVLEALGVGGGVAAAGYFGVQAAQLWATTAVLNSMPMLLAAGPAALGVAAAGYAGYRLFQRARKPKTDGVNAPSKPGEPRHGNGLPPQPQPPIQEPRRPRRGRDRGMTTAGRVITTVGEVAAAGGMFFALKATFAAAGLAVPTMAVGLGAAVLAVTAGSVVRRLLRPRKDD
ncbi:MAG: hypothetical protein AAFY60_00455 [Myxococcota bacterium]